MDSRSPCSAGQPVGLADGHIEHCASSTKPHTQKRKDESAYVDSGSHSTSRQREGMLLRRSINLTVTMRSACCATSLGRVIRAARRARSLLSRTRTCTWTTRATWRLYRLSRPPRSQNPQKSQFCCPAGERCGRYFVRSHAALMPDSLSGRKSCQVSYLGHGLGQDRPSQKTDQSLPLPVSSLARIHPRPHSSRHS